MTSRNCPVRGLGPGVKWQQQQNDSVRVKCPKWKLGPSNKLPDDVQLLRRTILGNENMRCCGEKDKKSSQEK